MKPIRCSCHSIDGMNPDCAHSANHISALMCCCASPADLNCCQPLCAVRANFIARSRASVTGDAYCLRSESLSRILGSTGELSVGAPRLVRLTRLHGSHRTNFGAEGWNGLRHCLHGIARSTVKPRFSVGLTCGNDDKNRRTGMSAGGDTGNGCLPGDVSEIALGDCTPSHRRVSGALRLLPGCLCV